MTAKAKTEWSLVCITSKGKVSILKNLDLFTARETYKKLKPDGHPITYIYPDCAKKNGFFSWGGRSYGGGGDRLERIEVIGPEGIELDPWHGVEPRVVDLRAQHENQVRAGFEECSVCSAMTADAKEERRRRELLKAVPTAFWLEEHHAH